jgi:hypothetical protein
MSPADAKTFEINQRTFCVLGGQAATLALTLLGWTFHLGALTIVGGLLVGLAGLTWWVRGELIRGEAFVAIPSRARTAMSWAVVAAAAAHAAWMAAFLLAWPVPLWEWVRVPLLLGVTEWVVAGLWTRRITKVRPPSKDLAVVVHEAELAGPPPTAEASFAAALDRIGRSYLQIESHAVLDYGFTFSVRLPSQMAVMMAAQAATQDGKAKQTRSEIRHLTRDDTEFLAIAWSEVTGNSMMADWVVVTDEREAGMRQVTVITCDVLALAHPYPLEQRRTRGARVLAGVRIDGLPITLNARQHVALVGKTGSGKTGTANCLFAELTLPDEVTGLPGRVWVGGRRKIYDLVGQWLDCHLDTDRPLPFDWVVQGQEDTLDMLVTAMTEAQRRQALPHAERAGLEDIWVWIEEVASFLRDTSVKAWFSGRWYTASELYAEARQTTKSAGIFLVDLAQQFTNAMYGDEASSVKANVGAMILMQSTNGDERGEMFGKGGAAMGDLYNAGEFYLRDGAAPVRGKSLYIQEIDARMAALHDGPNVVDVSMARSAMLAAMPSRPDVIAGEAYAARPRTMTREFHEYLRGVAAMKELAAAPVRPELSIADQVRELVATMDDEVAVFEQALAPPMRLAPVKPPPRTDRIVALLTAAGGPMATADIMAALHAEGDLVERGPLDNTLSALAGKQRVRRVSDGVYAVSSHVSSHA